MISFSENSETDFIAYEAGSALCSVTDPRSEALKWVYSLGHLPTNHIVVVGLGAGFHIEALVDFDENIKITVVESRASLVSVFWSQFPELASRVQVLIVEDTKELLKSDEFNEMVSDKAYVISFRECWGEQVSRFSKLFACLTGRDIDSLRYHFEEMGMNIKSTYSAPNRFLNIKDVTQLVEETSLPEDKKNIFRTLNELVK